MARYQTTGYQWFCNVETGDCDEGSNGGYDGSEVYIKEKFERQARAHTKASGHPTVVERCQRIDIETAVLAKNGCQDCGDGTAFKCCPDCREKRLEASRFQAERGALSVVWALIAAGVLSMAYGLMAGENGIVSFSMGLGEILSAAIVALSKAVPSKKEADKERA